MDYGRKLKVKTANFPGSVKPDIYRKSFNHSKNGFDFTVVC